MNRKNFGNRAERADGIRSRQMILDAASKLATTEGLDGLSIGRLAEHIGMSKSGLYAHFGSKEELQLATVDAARETFQNAIIAPAQSITDPIEQVEALCNRFLDYLESRVFPGGCFFATVAAEFGSHHGPVRSRIAEVQRGWEGLLAGLLGKAQGLGLISPREDANRLTFELSAYLLMANQHVILLDDDGAIERARQMIHARLAAARLGKPAISKEG
jgi:AcrR family transcriptional regulator